MAALKQLFRPRPAKQAGRRLYAAAVAKARDPAFYGEGRAPDTPEGRFELYTLHVILLLHRLKRQGPQAQETGQALFDAYLRGLDDGLRELGVGDLSVGKRMRKLGEAAYGRVKAYDEALPAYATAPEGLTALIGRTILENDAHPFAAPLAAYAAKAAAGLEGQGLEALYEGTVDWPEFAA